MEVGWNLLLAQYARFGQWQRVLADTDTLDADKRPCVDHPRAVRPCARALSSRPRAPWLPLASPLTPR